MKIKLNNFLLTTKTTFQRFPLVIIFAIVSATLGFFLVDYYSSKTFLLFQTSILGIPAFLLVHLYSEIYDSFRTKVSLPVLTFIFLGIFYYATQDREIAPQGLFFSLFFNAFLLLITAVHYRQISSVKFWDFTETLFLRFVFAFICSLALFLGIVLAILALDTLFELQIRPDIYAKIGVIIFLVFNNWLFLAGIPSREVVRADKEIVFVKVLEVFIEYILIPLSILYLLITYIYLFKILITWHIPKNIVVYFVLTFASVGLLNLMLIFPIPVEKRKIWIKYFAQYFPLAILPLLILLLSSILQRIGQYGFTENRYFILLAGLWFLAINLFLFFTKQKNIKIIPLSLGMSLILSNFGFWGIYEVPKSSQFNRLLNILEEYKAIENGKVTKLLESKKLKEGDLENIKSILDFLIQRKALDKITPYFDKSLSKALKQELYSEAKINTVLSYIFTDKVENLSLPVYTNQFSFEIKNDTLLPQKIEKYDYLLDLGLQSYQDSKQKNIFLIDKRTYEIKADFDKNNIMIYRNQEEYIKINLQVLFAQLLKKHKKDDIYNYQISQNELILIEESSSYKLKLLIENLNFEHLSKKQYKLNGIQFILMIKLL